MIRAVQVPLTPLAILATLWLVDEAANVLAWRGHINPHADEWPPALVAELVGLAVDGPCTLCLQIPLCPDALADHYLSVKQEEWEHSLAPWVCDCGRVYKIITEFDTNGFHLAMDDGPRGPFCEAWFRLHSDPDADCPHDSCPAILFDRGLGVLAGKIRRNRHGGVKSSDACVCGRVFAVTIAGRTVPEGALF